MLLKNNAWLMLLPSLLSCHGLASLTPPGNPSSTQPVVVDPPAKLSGLVGLTGLSVEAHSDGANITFDGVDGAADYRIYALPAESDVQLLNDGTLSIPNAVYRCAGQRPGNTVRVDDLPDHQKGELHTYLKGSQTNAGQPFDRKESEALLGYVFRSAGSGRVPVYALGDPDSGVGCYDGTFQESRHRVYTPSASERATKLTAGWRDDGIAFYAPDSLTTDAQWVDSADGWSWQSIPIGKVLFLENSPEGLLHGPNLGTARDSGGTHAFEVLAHSVAETSPLYRVFYSAGCGPSNDVLAVGQADLNWLRFQGQQPLPALTWSGMSEPTQVVVEALDQGCPFSGQLAAMPQPAGGYMGWYKAWKTLPEMAMGSASGEVYINGQFGATSRPKAIRRTVLQLTPAEVPAMDFFDNFSVPSTFTPVARGGWGEGEFTSPNYDVNFFESDADRRSVGIIQGQLWARVNDIGADVGGKVRVTAKQKAKMVAGSYLHVTLEADGFTAGRRYPQIIITDQNIPIPNNLALGNALIVETFAGIDWPGKAQVEVCDHFTWEVNHHCPSFDFQYTSDDRKHLMPNDQIVDRVGLDRSLKFDLYASTADLYLLIDGKPYGCANLPAAGTPQGPVTVSFGQVIYHSGIAWWPFTNELAMGSTSSSDSIETNQRYDNFGFQSGVAAPVWDHARFPCTGTLH